MTNDHHERMNTVPPSCALRHNMNALNNTKLAAKKAAGINIHLYSDDHPETTVRGTGFKDADTARRTIELVRQKPRNRQVWTINAMYYRAKHHPHQTPAMRDAMRIFEAWLDEYKQEKREASQGRKDKKIGATDVKESNTKRGRSNGTTENAKCEDGDYHLATLNAKKARPDSSLSLLSASSPNSRRSVLELEYKSLFNVNLPKVARSGNWPIHLNHCLMRVALDAYWQCCWYDKLDQKKGALKSMTVPQIENVILVGERMAAEGKGYVSRLNTESLGYRGKRGLGGAGGSAGAKKNPPAGTHSSNQQKLRFATVDKSAVDPGLAMASVLKVEETASKNDNKTDASSVRKSDNYDRSKNKHNNVEVNEGALLQVQRATTGRASCRGCKEKIGKGEYRVGMKAWSSGREITVWHHPGCFVGGHDGRCGAVRVEKLSKGTSARCKYTGGSFAKGDLRLVLEVGASKYYYNALEAINPLLSPVYDVLGSTTVPPVAGEDEGKEPSRINPLAPGSHMPGLDQLSRDDREAILAAL